MPNWKKIVVSGSDATLNSLYINTSVTASVFSGSQFTGSLFGTASWARNAISASSANTSSWALNFITGSVTSASFASTSSNVLGGTTNYLPIWNTNTSLSSSAIYQTAGNIGIGTTGPVSIGANIRSVEIQGSSGGGIAVGTSANRSYVYGATNLYLQAETDIIGYAGGSERIRVKSDGNVGIGTTSPGGKLDVAESGVSITTVSGVGLDTKVAAVGSWARANRIYNSNYTASTAFFGVLGGASSTTYTYWTIGDPTSTDATGYNAGGIYMSSSGFVGIGTSTPGYKLDVNGSSRSDLHIFRSNQSAPTADAFIFRPADNTVALGTANTERLRINSSGNVGIGTTSPDVFSRAYSGKILGISSTGQSAIELNGAAGSAAYIDMGVNGTRYLGLYSDASSSDISTIGAYPLTFGTNSTTRMTITSGGNVGIGTTSPSYKLHVEGTVFAKTGSSAILFREYNDGAILFMDGTNGDFIGADYWGLYAQSDKLWSINYGAGSDYLVVSSSGNVGIGTTSPSYLLHTYGSNPRNFIQDSGTGYPILQLQNDSGQFYFAIDNSAGTGFGSAYARWIYGSGNYPIIFATNGSARMIIEGGGNVGIGTTSPTNKFDVTVNLDGVQRVAIFKNTFSTGYTTVAIDRPNNVRASLLEHSTAGTTDWYVGTGYNAGTSNSTYQIGSGINLSDAKVVVTTGGNVGIGTTSPNYPLQVRRAGGAGSLGISIDNVGNTDRTVQYFSVQDSAAGVGSGHAFYYRAPSSTTDTFGFILDEAGNVGIGTTSPSSRLHLSSSGNTELIVDASSAGSSILSMLSTSGGNGLIGYSSIGALRFGTVTGPNGTGLSERMRIDANGNVGIGTTSPGSGLKLDVNGVAAATYFGGNRSNPSYGQFEAYMPASDGTYGNNYAYYSLHRGGSTDWQIGMISSSFVIANGGGASQYTLWTNRYFAIDTNGNVGIGTTSPLFNLQVGANAGTIATTTLRLQNSYLDTNGTYGFNIDAVDNGVNGHDLRFLGRTGPSSAFSELVRIKNSGNVGIGTTSPSSLLTVAGNISSSAAVYFKGLTSTTQANIVGLDTTTGQLFYQSTSSITVGTATSASYAATASNILGGTTNYLARWTSATTLGIGVTYDDGTNVGIGNTIPGTDGGVVPRLAVANPSNTNKFVGIGYDNTGDYGFIHSIHRATAWKNLAIQAFGGNVGIGTTSPGYLLTLVGSAGVFATENATSFVAKNSSGTYETYLWPRWSDNVMYLNYGSSGFNIRNNSSTTTMFMTNAGYVGINNTSPQYYLDIAGGEAQARFVGSGPGYVQGSILLSSGTDNTPSFRGQGVYLFNEGTDTTWYMGSPYTQGDAFILARKGSTTSFDSSAAQYSNAFITVNNSGNVGIGTSSPATKLHVSGSTAKILLEQSTNDSIIESKTQGAGAYFVANSVNAEGYYGLEMQLNGTGKWWVGSYNTNDFVVGRGSRASYSDYFHIATGGNIGINTTSPQAKLQVVGNVILGQNSNSSTSATVDITAGGISYNALIDFGYYNTFDAGIYYVGYYGADGGQFKIKDGSSGVAYERFVIYNSGNVSMALTGSVGIGTTSPSQKLTVRGSISTAAGIETVVRIDGGTAQPAGGINILSYSTDYVRVAGIQSQDRDGNNRALVLNPNAENVGIGTTSPSRKLHIGSGAGSSPWMLLQGAFTTASADHSRIYFNDNNFGIGCGKWSAGEGGNDDDLYLWSFNGTGRDIRFAVTTDGSTPVTSSNWTTNMIIKNDGSVGIGTTSPAFKLDVSGSNRQARIGTAELGDWPASTGYAYFGHEALNHSSATNYALLQDSTGFTYLNVASGKSMQFRIANADRMIMDSAGNFGIGTSPSYRLDISGSLAFTSASVSTRFADKDSVYHRIFTPLGNVGLYLGGSDNGNYYDNGNHYFRSAGGGTTYVYINGSGNVGIGTTSPTVKLQVQGAISASGQITNTDIIRANTNNISGSARIGTYFNNTTIAQFVNNVFSNSSTSYGYMQAGDGTNYIAGSKNIFEYGNVGINNTSPSYRLDVTGDARVNTGALGVNVAPNATDGRIDASNDIVAYSSDKRLKTNIQFIQNPLDKLEKLSGFTYNWNDKAKELANYNTEESLVGVFAQDVQEVLPEAVKLAPFDNNGNNESISGENYLTVQYEKIVPLLIEAIKEQQKQIDELKYLLQNKS